MATVSAATNWYITFKFFTGEITKSHQRRCSSFLIIRVNTKNLKEVF